MVLWNGTTSFSLPCHSEPSGGEDERGICCFVLQTRIPRSARDDKKRRNLGCQQTQTSSRPTGSRRELRVSNVFPSFSTRCPHLRLKRRDRHQLGVFSGLLDSSLGRAKGITQSPWNLRAAHLSADFIGCLGAVPVLGISAGCIPSG